MEQNKTIPLSEAIAALERGEEIEFSDKDMIHWYSICLDDLLDFKKEDYRKSTFRIKQKPMEIWVNISKDPDGFDYIYTSEKAARDDSRPEDKRVAVHFREVI